MNEKEYARGFKDGHDCCINLNKKLEQEVKDLSILLDHNKELADERSGIKDRSLEKHLRLENEKLQSELSEQCRINGIGAQRELKLMAENARLKEKLELALSSLGLFEKELKSHADGTHLKCNCGKPKCHSLWLTAGDEVYRVSYINTEKLKKAIEQIDEMSEGNGKV